MLISCHNSPFNCFDLKLMSLALSNWDPASKVVKIFWSLKDFKLEILSSLLQLTVWLWNGIVGLESLLSLLSLARVFRVGRFLLSRSVPTVLSAAAAAVVDVLNVESDVEHCGVLTFAVATYHTCGKKALHFSLTTLMKQWLSGVRNFFEGGAN